MKPLLAHIFDPSRLTHEPYWVQPKFNGVRALYQAGHFQSRDELPWNTGVLDHLTKPLMHMFPDDRTILDGELYVHGWPLQRINGAVAVNRLEPNEDTVQVGYYIFDKVAYHKPFLIRFSEVEGNVRMHHHPNIFAATTVLAPNPAWVEQFYINCVADGFEGIMYRLSDCPYTTPKQPKPNEKGFLSDKNNRCWHLLKRKDWQDDEFRCIAVEEGVGKRSGMVGAFICETRNGSTFGVGSGLTDAEALHYLEHPPIGRNIKVKFLTYTKYGVPFNPTVEAVL